MQNPPTQEAKDLLPEDPMAFIGWTVGPIPRYRPALEDRLGECRRREEERHQEAWRRALEAR